MRSRTHRLRLATLAVAAALLAATGGPARAAAEPIQLSRLHVRVADFLPSEQAKLRAWGGRFGQGAQDGCIVESLDWETPRRRIGMSDWRTGCAQPTAARAIYEEPLPGFACRALTVPAADAAQVCRGDGKLLNQGWQVRILVGPIVADLATDGRRHGCLGKRALTRRAAPRLARRLRAAVDAAPPVPLP